MKYQLALGMTVHGLLEYVEAGGLMFYPQTRSIGFEDASLLASSTKNILDHSGRAHNFLRFERTLGDNSSASVLDSRFFCCSADVRFWHKRTSNWSPAMSAFGGKADIGISRCGVRPRGGQFHAAVLTVCRVW